MNVLVNLINELVHESFCDMKKEMYSFFDKNSHHSGEASDHPKPAVVQYLYSNDFHLFNTGF